LTVVGYDQVNGAPTIHLRLRVSSTSEIDLWVAADTYLPVQLKVPDLGRAPGQMITYAWLPRTPANLAKVNLTPPPGLTETLAVSPSAPLASNPPPGD
jgi:hypothetical protein